MKAPAGAAHAWLIQNKSKVKGGGASLSDPLQYLPRKEGNEKAHEREDSRKKVMYSRYAGKRAGGWVPKKRFVKHSRTALHPEIVEGDAETISCDEFPFSSTYQSPGVPTAIGGHRRPEL
ncbi:hypothetical protein [Streptomyces sp. NPDC058644]|uniref:hypothetical protein n=1 Tax=unclassified Streptomyces TaxID=2593676 RepID=UPI0036472630